MRDEAAGIPKSVITMDGCHVAERLGATPIGNVLIKEIQTQTSIMDSGTFEIEIFKDKAET
jgi:hypothetical protein